MPTTLEFTDLLRLLSLRGVAALRGVIPLQVRAAQSMSYTHCPPDEAAVIREGFRVLHAEDLRILTEQVPLLHEGGRGLVEFIQAECNVRSKITLQWILRGVGRDQRPDILTIRLRPETVGLANDPKRAGTL